MYIYKKKTTIFVCFNTKIIAGLDFDYESDKIPTTPDASQYETCYVTSHKAPCRAAAFDPAGSVIATGSVDASIKILDVDRYVLSQLSLKLFQI